MYTIQVEPRESARPNEKKIKSHYVKTKLGIFLRSHLSEKMKAEFFCS